MGESFFMMTFYKRIRSPDRRKPSLSSHKVSKNSILQISLKSIAIIKRRFKIEDKYFLEKD